MEKRWPLHPHPRSYETLALYVRRRAECYGARYEYFCFHALGIPFNDSDARRLHDPAPEVLLCLSIGTGIPVTQLEQMTLERIWDRLTEGLRQVAVTPEGKAWLEQVTSSTLSQNCKLKLATYPNFLG